jgi:hypothetical protein
MIFDCPFRHIFLTIKKGSYYLHSKLSELSDMLNSLYLQPLQVRFVSFVTNIKLQPNCQNSCFQETEV